MIMDFFKNLLTQEDGQGLVEYTLIVFLVLFAFWLGVKDTSIGVQLSSVWSNIANCLGAPFSCAVV
jgi:Flp pilus assembly pilin Flp